MYAWWGGGWKKRFSETLLSTSERSGERQHLNPKGASLPACLGFHLALQSPYHRESRYHRGVQPLHLKTVRINNPYVVWKVSKENQEKENYYDHASLSPCSNIHKYHCNPYGIHVLPPTSSFQPLAAAQA